jgi:hypothetical protein
MNAFTCDDVRTHLPLFAGGDLDAADAESVRSHLIECVGCRNEAAGLQRALAGLRAAGARSAPGVDDAWFAAMQRSICERVDAAGAAPLASGSTWRAWGLAVAALLLVGVGFALGRSREAPSVFTRPATPVDFGPLKAVPYAGPRAPLLLLGNDEHPDTAQESEQEVTPAAGMRARDELRTLVDDGMVLPPRKRPHR